MFLNPETVVLPFPDRPPGARSDAYEDYFVQDLVIHRTATVYRRQRLFTPEDKYLLTPLPDTVPPGSHFGAGLIAYLIYQYRQCNVTQLRLREELLDLGIDISPGQVERILHAPGRGAATAVQTRVWAPPTPIRVFPALFSDDFEVRVFSSVAGPTLVAAIELVSPGNKDREETRRAFTAKCAAYLQRGIGLMVVDIVTSRHANLHDDLMALLGHTEGMTFPTPTPLYATAYRPAHRQERNEIDLWRESLALGQPLPRLPLAVRGLGCLPIDLERTYMEARTRGRIG